VATHRVILVRGDTWLRTWDLQDEDGTPIDLTGASARVQVRDWTDALVLSASTADGRLTISPTIGRVQMAAPAAATAALAPGRYAFDFELSWPDGTRVTYESATLLVQEDVARD
jgi:hypothetical protein